MKLLCASLLTLLLLGANTSLHAADAPIVREVFACNFVEDNDMDDLMKARDYFVSRFDDLGLTDENHFVWTPFKANVDFDFLWASNHSDMIAFGQRSEKFNSDVGEAVAERFNQVAECRSSLSMRREVYSSPMTGGTPPVLISSSRCNLVHGTSDDDLEDLWRHINDVLTDMNAAGVVLYASEPMVGQPSSNAPDLFLYSVQDTVEVWAQRQAAIAARDPGLIRHFENRLDCTNSFWWGQRVVPVPE